MLLSLALTLTLAVQASWIHAPSSPQIALAGTNQRHVPGENPLTFCTTPSDDILDIEKVDLSPNPPLAGQKLTITATGNLREPIEKGAYVAVQVKYGLVTLIRQTLDLCDQVADVDLECPLDEGPIKFTKDIDLPSNIPAGNYKAQAHAFTKDGANITCLETEVHFGPS